MKVKTFEHDGKKYAVLDTNGNPVYVYDDGKESGFDAPGTSSRIGALNREAQGHRETAERLQADLDKYKDIKDPAAALTALSTVQNLKGGELKTAEQVEEIKREAQRTAEQQVRDTAAQSATRIQDLEKQLGDRTSQLNEMTLGSAFGNSKFIASRVAMAPAMLRDVMGKHFKVEDGKLVPYDANGNKLYSRTRHGELADFEEGIEMLVDSHPHKGQILKGTGNSGTGAQPGTGGEQQSGGKTVISREKFDATPHHERAALLKTHVIQDAAA